MVKENKIKLSNKKIKILFFCILIIILIAVIIVIYINFFKNKKTEEIPISPARMEEIKIVEKELAENKNVEIKDDEKINISEVLTKDSTVKGYEDVKVSEKKLIYKNGAATFSAKFSNNTDIDMNPFTFKMTFVNKENEVLGAYLNKSEYIMAGSEIPVYLIANTDISNAYDVILEVIDKFVYDAKKGDFVREEDLSK